MGASRVALQVLGSSLPIPVAYVVGCPLQGMGDYLFNPRP